MFRNYLTTLLRNVSRSPLYAAINIVGLSVGFAAALLIALVVRDELTYDTWVPDHENVFRLSMAGNMRGGVDVHTDGMHPSNALMLRQGIPEVERVARLLPQKRGVRGDTYEGNDSVIWADSEFLEIFPVAAVAGDPVAALRRADQAVVTRTFANKYFGREDVIGETLELDRKVSLEISAVIVDFPSRTHLNVGVLVAGVSSASPLATAECCNVSVDGALTYVQIEAGSAGIVAGRFPDLIDRFIPGDKYGPDGEFMKASYAYAFDLVPLAKLHTLSWSGRYIPTHHGVLKPPGEPALVPALLGTGALIFLVSMVSVLGLISARAGRRMTEIGIRKVSGARRVHLTAQFLGEAAIYALLSLLLSLASVALALPAVNAFLERDLTLDLADPWIAGAAGLLAAVAVVSGAVHPALLLTVLRPAKALKAGLNAQSGSGALRHAFVLSQFAVLIAMIIAALAIDRQTRFAMSNGLRFNTDQVIVIDPPCNTSFKERVAAVPGVRGVACTGPGFLTGSEAVGLQTSQDGRQFPLNYIGVDPGFMDLLGIRPLAGQLPTERRSEPGIILNESASRQFGFATAADAIGKTPSGPEVVAVVPDFPLRSLRDAPMPTAFIQTRDTPRTPSIAIVKLSGGQVPEALRGIDAAWDSLNTGRPTPRSFYDQFVQSQYTDLVRQAQAFRTLSVTAVLLAALGLFGLAAFTAEQRTKEIGIRKSMGATRGDILALLLWQFVKPVLLANMIAWPAAYLIMQHWLEGFTYHVELSPWMFVGSSVAALAIALATVIGHALLVARAHPVSALRYE